MLPLVRLNKSTSLHFQNIFKESCGLSATVNLEPNHNCWMWSVTEESSQMLSYIRNQQISSYYIVPSFKPFSLFF